MMHRMQNCRNHPHTSYCQGAYNLHERVVQHITDEEIIRQVQAQLQSEEWNNKH